MQFVCTDVQRIVLHFNFYSKIQKKSGNVKKKETKLLLCKGQICPGLALLYKYCPLTLDNIFKLSFITVAVPTKKYLFLTKEIIHKLIKINYNAMIKIDEQDLTDITDIKKYRIK